MRRERTAAVLLVLALCLALGSCVLRPGSGGVPYDGPLSTATPSPTATPLPGESPAPSGPSRAEKLLAGMSLREKVGQLFIVRPDALDPGQVPAQIDDANAPGVTALTEEMTGMLARYPVGGVAVFSKNITDPEQLKTFLRQLQTAAVTPLFLAVDEEGGAVARIASHPAFSVKRYRSAAAVGAAGDPAAAGEMGRTIGAYLRELGFNMDFAPVADVNTNPYNPVIGARAFSSDPRAAAGMAAAMAEGLEEMGIIPVYKHFPGHGDTAEDSHNGIAVTGKNLQQLSECEWIPYTAADLTGRAVMVGHIAVPAVTGDLTPATLSAELVTGLLRQTLGFRGLVITDALGMGAVAYSYRSGDAAVLALEAGCDVLLMPADLAEAYQAVLDAVESGRITRERLDESVLRVLEYKERAGLLG